MKFRLITHIVLGMLLLTLFGKACKEPSQKTENGIIKVTIDWSGIPRPGKTSLSFYDTQGALVKQTDTETTCCDVELPEGKYQIIVHNTDAKQVEFRGMERHETAEVFACKNTNEEKSSNLHTLEPQNIYGIGTYQGGEKVAVIDAEVLNVTVCPVPLTKTLTLNFTISNIDVRSVVGDLTGVAEGVFLSTGKRNNTTCCVAFTGALKPGSTIDYKAHFNIFDLQTATKSEGVNCIELIITDHSGNVYKASADITSFLQNVANQNNGVMPADIPIVLDISPDPVTQQVNVSVLNWNPGGAGTQSINDNSNE